jgi:uncharacterized protein (TIGR02271 family)
MSAQTIGGLFTSQSRGEKALAELKAAKFSSAQISEVADSDDAPAPKKLSNPIADFFQDHTATGSEFRDNLTHLGISSADAQYFEDGVARGGALVTVKADERASEAVAILQRNGADLGSQGRNLSSAPVAASTTVTAAPAGGTVADADQMIQLRAERLSIDKVRVASGTVRIRKDVVTHQQNIDVPVMHEELVIERHPVTGSVAGGTIGDEKTITVPLSREEVKVSKDTFVTEEIDIGKHAVTNTEHVANTVRHEELVVEEPGRVADPQGKR